MKRILVMLLVALMVIGIATVCASQEQPKWHGWRGPCPYEPLSPYNCTVTT